MTKGGKQEQWTPQELKTLWENIHLMPKELAQLIPSKTYKAVKNYRGYFARISDRVIAHIQDHYRSKACTEIDEELGLVKGTTSNYLRMIGKEGLFRSNSWTDHEVKTLEKYAGEKTYREIAEMLETTEPRIRNMAHRLGLSSGYRYSLEEKHTVYAMFHEGKSSEQISEAVGRSVHSIRNFLSREGLIKGDANSIYYVSKPEEFIMHRIQEEFGIVFPDKSSPENRDYYWGIIPPYEVDIPFQVNGRKIAIEYDGEWWHNGKEEKDKVKANLLKEKGYLFFRITSNHHDRQRVETLNPVLDVIFQAIRQ